MNIFKGIVCFLMVLVLIGCGADEPIYDKVIYDENGNKYYADFNYENTSLYVGVGDSINLLKRSVSEIVDIFNKECDNPIFSSSVSSVVPKDWEDAVKYGISLLNSRFSEWTINDEVVVSFNKKENIWIVSGMRLDREHINKIGIAVFSGSSGELIAMGKM
mgnify:FL=1